jgi:hypothetical protein
MFGHRFCSLSDMISDERSSRLTTKIELSKVRELTESTDWFLPFHLFTPTHLAAGGQRGVRVFAQQLHRRLRPPLQPPLQLASRHRRAGTHSMPREMRKQSGETGNVSTSLDPHVLAGACGVGPTKA